MTRTRPNLFRDLLLATSALVASSALAVSLAHADGSVSGGKVIVGKAVITTSGGLTTIEQASKKALINWQSFSIPSGSTVNFEQPGSNAITVNRVIGSDPSNIFGNLLANGRIWLINSNGILFGHGSQINVGSLIATTSDISDSDFQNGHYRFAASKNPNGSVVNQGTIHAADHGSVVLSAPHVSNSGVIQANLGTVVLGGTSAFTVDLTGDNLIRYQVTQGVTQTQTNADGTAAALVANSGTIKANGGKVLMTERAAQQVEDSVINNTGIVEATSVSSHNGEIVLDAGDGGTVNAGGTLDASGKAAGQTGGSVTIAGSTVNVADGAKIDASGDRGGGTVLIGGGVHGDGSLQHATTTNIGNATITADAITKGNGGTVAVWSDGNTKFAGHVSARGGSQGGNGGFVETSGKNLQVDPSATVNTMAAAGKTGLWLLDPQDIDIVDGGTGGLNGSSIDPQTIINALATTDVELEATDDITIDSNVIYNSGNTFTMLAGNDIFAYASVQNSGGGNINLIGGWDGTTTDLSHLTDPGVYGNNDGSVFIGTSGAHGNVAIGSAGGVTTVAGYNVAVQSDEGYAQIGYHGAGGGDIDVLATAGGISVISDIENVAQIGNGGEDVNGAITGDISLTTTGGEVIVGADDESGQFQDYSFASIGQLAGANSSESGDIDIETNGGALVMGSTGNQAFAQIGNVMRGQSTGNISGDINIDAGLMEIVAGSNTQGIDYAEIGNGSFHLGTTTGATSGDITINAQSLILAAEPNGGQAQARIGDQGEGGTVTGDLNITTTGDIDIVATDSGLASVGGASLMQDAQGNFLPGEGSGDVTIDSGGNILIAAVDSGQARISPGGWISGTLSVTAQGDINLQTTGQNGNGFAVIGTVSGDMDFNITSRTGSIVLDAEEGNDIVGIGNDENAVTEPTSGNVMLSAANGSVQMLADGTNSYLFIGNQSYDTGAVSGNIGITANSLEVSASGDGSSAQIGNGSIYATGNVTGDISLAIAGQTNLSDGGGTGWFGNLVASGGNESGNLTLISGSLTADNAGEMFAADLGTTEDTGGDVTIGITGSNPLRINNGTEYSSPHTLSILAAGNVDLTGTIENDGSGDINVVAGWDGHTLDSSQFTTAGVFGNNGGSLNVGGSGANGNSGIGTAGGTLTVAADNINLDAVNGFAQLGYDAGGTGDIDVQATGNIDLTAGEVGFEYAQIGNGGLGASGGGGNITVNAGGDVSLTSGYDSNTYAQIGNGGEPIAGQTGDESGNISVTAADLTLTANDGWAMVGNGGAGSQVGAGTHNSGDITLNIANDITLTSLHDFTQIGNGGSGTTGSDSGNISITAGGDVSLASGVYSFGTYAQIGNGGDQNEGDQTGNISIAANSLTLTADEGRAQVGNGGAAAGGNFTGDITLNIAKDVTVAGGGVDTWGFAMIGNGGDSTSGNDTGDISITAGGNVSLSGSGDFAQIGNGGWGSGGTHQGNITINATDVTVDGGNVNEFSYAQIGNGGEDSGGDNSGDIKITASGDVTLTGSGRYAQIGQGGGFSEGNNSGDITVSAAGNVTLSGGNAEEAYAQIGSGGAESNTGDFGGDTADAQDGGYSNTGSITVSGEAVTLQAGTGNAAYSQIGQGGFLSGDGLTGNGVDSGDITVNSQTTVSLLGGDGDDAYSQIGNGGDQVNAQAGATATADFEGNITVTALTKNGVTVQGGNGNSAYAQIGNGGLGIELTTTAPDTNFTVGGNIMVSDLTLTGGNTGTNAYAQVGNGDASLNSIADISGDITIVADGGTSATDGTAAGSVALLGNATGTGTVTGSVNGGGGESQIGDQVGTIASLVQTVDTVNFENIAPPTSFPVADEFVTEGVEVNTQPAGPLQQMASSDESGEGKEPSDAVANSVGQSLSGKGHKQARVAQVIIPGVLKQIVLVNAQQPKGIPPADEDYSSWGNEAFWQW